MSSILKIKIPFFRKVTHDSADGLGTFYLNEEPKYLPTLNQTVLITHTEVPSGSGLALKLTTISSNTVPALFQSFTQNASQGGITNPDNFTNFITLQYLDTTFSVNQFAGNCRGFIEFDLDPSTYSVTKPIESKVIVNESVTFDGVNGYQELYCSTTGITGNVYDIMPAFFIKRKATNNIFANILESFNLPVSDEDLLKYSRTAYGYFTGATASQTPTTIIGGNPYIWIPLTTPTMPSGVNAVYTHPVTGEAGEYYNTVLQSIGSYNFVPDLNQLPIPNDLFLIFEIPNNKYGEIIDGKTIKMTLPYWTGTTSTNATKKRLGILDSYGTTPQTISIYGTYNKSNLNLGIDLDTLLSDKDLSLQDLGQKPDLSVPVGNYESNITLLFSDIIKKPFEDSTGSWGSGHADVIDGVRVFDPTSREKNLYDYNNDVCVGFTILDKGFVVITHPLLVDSLFINAFNGAITTGGTSNGLKVYDFYANNPLSTSKYRKNSTTGYGVDTITGTTNMIFTENNLQQVDWESTQFLYTGSTAHPHPQTPSIEFLSYNTEKSLNIVCLASSNEFFKSTNPTARQLLNTPDTEDYANFNTSNGNLYPVMISQVGLHDAQGNLLAIARPSSPITKFWYDIASFSIKIKL